MSNNAYIKLVPGSVKDVITTEDVKKLFYDYKQIKTKTGNQVGWEFERAVFPYDIKEKPEGKEKWFYLEAAENLNVHDRFNLILIGVDTEMVKDKDGNEQEQYYIQLTLPTTSTYGDKGKAIEFAKFLAEKLQSELHLFNRRIMYFNKRK